MHIFFRKNKNFLTFCVFISFFVINNVTLQVYFFIRFFMEKQAMMNQFTPNLFWDADPADLDIDKHKAYVIGRVLDYGQRMDWVLIRNYYGLETIRDVALRIRIMNAISLSYVATVTDTPEIQFRCYKEIHSKNPLWYY